MQRKENIDVHIYKIINTVNNKVYIGQTYRNVHTRFMEHMIDEGSAVYPDVCKYGRNVFTYVKIHTCLSQYANQWEHYYICKYDATNLDFGYNKISTEQYRWSKGSVNPSKTESGKQRISEYNRTHMDEITVGFIAYNESQRFPVEMKDDNDNVIATFDSLSDACRYLNKPLCGTSRIKQICDKYKRNGKPYRFYGYGWTALNKNVQTNCKADDELLSE